MNYEITVNEIANGGNIRGFASVVFEDSFKVTGIAVMERSDNGELFVAMPRYKSSTDDSGYRDICNPITKDFREELYGNILAAYDNLINEGTKRYTVGEPKDGELDFSVRVYPFEREGSSIRGLGSIVIGDSFAVGNISILNGKKGLFVSMPSRLQKGRKEGDNPKYTDICFPVTAECRKAVYDGLLKAYEQELTKMQVAGTPAEDKKQAKGGGIREKCRQVVSRVKAQGKRALNGMAGFLHLREGVERLKGVTEKMAGRLDALSESVEQEREISMQRKTDKDMKAEPAEIKDRRMQEGPGSAQKPHFTYQDEVRDFMGQVVAENKSYGSGADAFDAFMAYREGKGTKEQTGASGRTAMQQPLVPAAGQAR